MISITDEEITKGDEYFHHLEKIFKSSNKSTTKQGFLNKSHRPFFTNQQNFFFTNLDATRPWFVLVHGYGS